jgi:hypothetical protein
VVVHCGQAIGRKLVGGFGVLEENRDELVLQLGQVVVILGRVFGGLAREIKRLGVRRKLAGL